MGKREQIEERRYFSNTEKLQILVKSNKLCAHCGKPLRIGDNFSIEHVIPLTKGGTNDLDNLVALCKTCNEEKSDLVIDPWVYYPYVSTDTRRALQHAQADYYESHDWVSAQDFSKADVYGVRMAKYLYINGRGKTYGTKLLHGMTVEKMYYNSMDEVYDFKCKYYKKLYMRPGVLSVPVEEPWLMKQVKSSLRSSMDVDFRINACYIVRRPNKTILGTFSMLLYKVRLEGRELFALGIPKICIVRYNADTIIQLAHAIDIVVNNLCVALNLDVLLVSLCASDMALVGKIALQLRNVCLSKCVNGMVFVCLGFKPVKGFDDFLKLLIKSSEVIGGILKVAPDKLDEINRHKLSIVLPDVDESFREDFFNNDVILHYIRFASGDLLDLHLPGGAGCGSKESAEAICREYMNKIKGGG